MKIPKLYFLIFILLLTTACKENTTTFKFTRNESGHIIIPFTINDSIVFGVFDTGASMSTIEEAERERIDLAKSNDSMIVWCRNLTDEPYHTVKTVGSHVAFNNIVLEEPIAFIIVDNHELNNIVSKKPYSFVPPNEYTIIGCDIIDRFNWLFDFKNNELTISRKPIPFDMVNSIIIHYRNELDFKLCTLYLPRMGLLDNVAIDTGASWFSLDEPYAIWLGMPEYLEDIDNSNPVIIEGYENYNLDSVDLHHPFINVEDGNHITIYKGWKWYHQSALFNSEKDIGGFISLPYSIGYSYMYMDTQNNKIYLKK